MLELFNHILPPKTPYLFILGDKLIDPLFSASSKIGGWPVRLAFEGASIILLEHELANKCASQYWLQPLSLFNTFLLGPGEQLSVLFMFLLF